MKLAYSKIKKFKAIKIKVVAYSGNKANKRPVYFVLGMRKMEAKKVFREIAMNVHYFVAGMSNPRSSIDTQKQFFYSPSLKK